jgi:hypothetical protein
VAWDIRLTREAKGWLLALGNDERARIVASLDHLEQHGPQLGRPTVDSIRHSRHHNMKELRSFGGNLRMLFAFDPRRTGVVLVGGDKTDNWKRWYRENIPKADRLYDQHLRNIGKDGPWRDGGRSDDRSR